MLSRAQPLCAGLQNHWIWSVLYLEKMCDYIRPITNRNPQATGRFLLSIKGRNTVNFDIQADYNALAHM